MRMMDIKWKKNVQYTEKKHYLLHILYFQNVVIITLIIIN